MLAACTHRHLFPRLFVIAATTALLASAPMQAAALSPAKEAASYFEQGTKAFRHHHYARAAEKFMRAYEIAPHGAALYNAALAWEKGGDVERSADAFEQALKTEQLTDKQQADAERHLAKWKARLGQLVFAQRDEVTVSVGRFEGKKTPFRAYFKPGSYDVAFTFSDDQTRIQHVDVSAGVIVHVDPPDEHAAKPQEDVPDGVDEHAEETDHTLAWVSLGLAGVATGGAVLFGLRALDAKSEFEQSEFTSQDAHDRAASYRTWTNVSWAAAGVLAASGGALFLLGGSKGNGADHEKDTSSATVVLTPTAGGAVISGQF